MAGASSEGRASANLLAGPRIRGSRSNRPEYVPTITPLMTTRSFLGVQVLATNRSKGAHGLQKHATSMLAPSQGKQIGDPETMPGTQKSMTTLKSYARFKQISAPESLCQGLLLVQALDIQYLNLTFDIWVIALSPKPGAPWPPV
eukprot:gene13524-19389_t